MPKSLLSLAHYCFVVLVAPLLVVKAADEPRGAKISPSPASTVALVRGDESGEAGKLALRGPQVLWTFYDFGTNIFDGNNNASPINYPGIGNLPSPGLDGEGGEMYDLEGINFAEDQTFFYITVTSSFGAFAHSTAWGEDYYEGDLFFGFDGTNDQFAINVREGLLYRVDSWSGIPVKPGTYGANAAIRSAVGPWRINSGTPLDSARIVTTYYASEESSPLLPGNGGTWIKEYRVYRSSFGSHVNFLAANQINFHATIESGNDLLEESFDLYRRCGDANGAGSINLSDLIYISNYIFSGGPPPQPLLSGDVDGCASVNTSDLVHLINYIFEGGPAPCSGGVCSLPTGQNAVILHDCPYVFSEYMDSLAIPVYFRNEVPLGAFSLGFSYNTDLYEITSATVGPWVPPGASSFVVRPKPAENMILVGWYTFSLSNPLPVHAAGSEVLAFTLFLRRAPGAQTSCIDIDSVFVAPGGPFIFSAQGGGTITPGFVDCGTADIEINGGCVADSCHTIGVEPWSIANDATSMWPQSWWQDFNYCSGEGPCQRFCILCGQSDFPNWDLFVSAIGNQQAYFDPPPGNARLRPSAIAQWEAIRGAWTGSCFGFAAGSYLFYDNYLQLESLFPGHSSLASVPLDSASRSLVNRYYLYQFGYREQQLINDLLTTKTPAQTLEECRVMFIQVPPNDRVMMLFNQNGTGGHAVAPYRCLQDGSNLNHWYLYVHDSNFPADSSQRITIDLGSNSWSYTGQPGWGGTRGLFLLDPVGNYLDPLVLSDNTEADEQIRFYFGDADSASFSSALGTVGFDQDGSFGSAPGASPITPVDGVETMPMGFFLPTGQWYSRASGVVDGVFTILDGSRRIFRHGGAKSGIISSYYKANATAPSLTVYGNSGGKSDLDIYDSIFIEVICIAPDSEVVVNLSGIDLDLDDSLAVTVTPGEAVRVDNFGPATTYDLLLQIVSPGVDTSFYTANIPISISTSHLITPDWRPSGDSVVIAIDTSMGNDFDSTITVSQHETPQFLCGDANHSGAVSITDVVFLIRYLFASGPPPVPLAAGDANCSRAISISDAVYLINFLFANGPMPCADCP